MAVAFSEHDAGQAWAHVLERARVDLPETTIVMWFDDVRAVALTDQALSLAVPSPLVKERLQHNHLHLIEEAAAEAAGHPVKIELEVNEDLRSSAGGQTGAPATDPEARPPAASAPAPPRRRPAPRPRRARSRRGRG